jgi:hypothetical protein
MAIILLSMALGLTEAAFRDLENEPVRPTIRIGPHVGREVFTLGGVM